jgi:hypothetical protein
MKFVKSILTWCGSILMAAVIVSPMYSWRTRMQHETERIKEELSHPMTPEEKARMEANRAWYLQHGTTNQEIDD